MTGTRKKILLLTSTFPRWKGDTDPPFVYDLALRLTRNCDVQVLCPHAPGTAVVEVAEGITVRRFRYFFKRYETLAYGGGILNRFRQSRLFYCLVPFFMTGELIAAVRTLWKETPDIINAHWLIPQGLIAVLAKKITRTGIPLVCTLHGGDIYGLTGPFLNRMKRYVLKHCDAVSVVSHAMADVVEDLGIERSKINVIPMGVDLKGRFIPSETFPRPESLLFVGRFAEKKGLLYLLDALPAVLAAHPAVRLTVVGHGPLEIDIRKRVTDLGIAHAVDIRGAVENINLPSMYQSSRIFVFPSIIDDRGDTEGFGLVMVEAMGCGCAVIASDLPAIHDSIIDGRTGLLCPQKSTPALAETIIRLLDDPEYCAQLSRHGREYVLERYDWEIAAKKYMKLFLMLTK